MELFGSNLSDHWGIVDFHDPVAEFARESLDAIMEVKVASVEKSEERRKERLRRERWVERKGAMKMIKGPKTTSEREDRLPKTSSEQKDRPAGPQVSAARDPLEQELGYLHRHAELDDAEADRSGYVSDDMLVDAV